MSRETRRMAVWWAVIAIALAAALVGFFCMRSAPPSQDELRPDSALPDSRHQQRDPRLARRHLRQLALALGKATQGLNRVSGTVSSSETGEPIPKAKITLEGALGGRFHTTTDDRGNYAVKVPPGVYRAFASADGFVPTGSAGFSRHPRPPAASDADLPLPELAPFLDVTEPRDGVDLELRGGATILGVVREPNGEPVAGAVVAGRLFGWEGRFTRLVTGADTSVSGGDGSFRIQVPAGSVELEASHDDYAGIADDASSLLHVSPGDEREIELTLVRGCIIEGQVVDRSGMPVPDGAIESWTGRGFPQSYEPAGTFQDGRFRYTHTGTGLVRLKAWPWKSTHSEPQDFDCNEGALFDDVLFEIPNKDPDFTGVVVDVDGVAVPGAFLDLLPLQPGGLAQQERADLSGAFAFFSQPSGPHVLSAYVPGEGVAAIEVTVPARDVRLQLGGTGGIEGTVKGLVNGSFTFVAEQCLEGGAGADWPVVGMRTLATISRVVRVEEGRFFIDDLPVCTLQAIARTPHAEQRVSVRVRADSDTKLSLDLTAPVIKTVHGTVYDSDGSPAPHTDVNAIFDFEVRSSLRRLPLQAFTTTDAEGRFDIQAFAGDTLAFRGPRGHATAQVSGNGTPVERIDVDLAPLPPMHPRVDLQELNGQLEALLENIPLH
ncbi:MAG: carboxypeptidase regulatory-like domain-containing protein [Deltaproteobacteria bacterium]|nr:carboxypeptidase regulatory-like domain-containing protein [Deltaproteobacteria bacterium]